MAKLDGRDDEDKLDGRDDEDKLDGRSDEDKLDGRDTAEAVQDILRRAGSLGGLLVVAFVSQIPGNGNGATVPRALGGRKRALDKVVANMAAKGKGLKKAGAPAGKR